MRLLIVTLALALSACGTTPPKSVGDLPEVKPVQLPPLRGRYAERAQPLPPLSGADWQSQQRDAVEADRAYNDVADRLNTVLDFYDCVRAAVNDRKTVEGCLPD